MADNSNPDKPAPYTWNDFQHDITTKGVPLSSTERSEALDYFKKLHEEIPQAPPFRLDPLNPGKPKGPG